jgi:hypothetical protein
MRVARMLIKMMKEELCELLQISVDQIETSMFITTRKVCILFSIDAYMLKGIEVISPSINFQYLN